MSRTDDAYDPQVQGEGCSCSAFLFGVFITLIVLKLMQLL